LLSKKAKLIIYRSIILPVELYGCETWTLTQEYENWFRVFENKVLRRIYGPKRDEDTDEWRRLHNEEFIELYIGYWWEICRGSCRLGDLRLDGLIM
jgi:hypothetical protein